MKNVVETTSLQLPAGTYWLDWGAAGSLTSGPWNPPITYPTVMASGDAMQFTGTGWVSLIDTAQAGTSDDSPQGMPFKIYGSNGSSVYELYANNNVSVYPNPMTTQAMVKISDKIQKASDGYTFIVYDLLGNAVKMITDIQSNNFIFHRDMLPSGIFMYKLLSDSKVIKHGKISMINK